MNCCANKKIDRNIGMTTGQDCKINWRKKVIVVKERLKRTSELRKIIMENCVLRSLEGLTLWKECGENKGVGQNLWYT